MTARSLEGRPTELGADLAHAAPASRISEGHPPSCESAHRRCGHQTERIGIGIPVAAKAFRSSKGTLSNYRPSFEVFGGWNE